MLSKVKKVVVSFVYRKRVPMKIERKRKRKTKKELWWLTSFRRRKNIRIHKNKKEEKKQRKETEFFRVSCHSMREDSRNVIFERTCAIFWTGFLRTRGDSLFSIVRNEFRQTCFPRGNSICVERTVWNFHNASKQWIIERGKATPVWNWSSQSPEIRNCFEFVSKFRETRGTRIVLFLFNRDTLHFRKETSFRSIARK